MTYITYHKRQYSRSEMDSTRRNAMGGANLNRDRRIGVYHCNQLYERIPSVPPTPNFMPSYLVRTSDMKVVKGSEVNEGYCTLSYSWNQSGEIRKNAITGKSYRVDEGKHKIIFPPQNCTKSTK